MTVSSINDSSAGTYSSATNINSSQQQDEFLQLLITQIQNQDPLNPMDNAEFTSQLTQLSSLDQLELLNANVEQNLIYSQSLNNTMMLGVVGKTATVAGTGTQIVDGEVSHNSVNVVGTGKANVNVLDEDGVVVATFTESVKFGMNDIVWDGKNKDGKMMSDGTYTLEIDVEDNAGASLDFDTFMTGRVDSIRFENNLAVMSINGSDFYAAEILEIGI